MKVLHLHTGPDGRSRFADLELALSPDPSGMVMELGAAVQGLAFRELSSGWSNDYHTAPRRQIVLQLSGLGEYVCGDGTSRVVGPGDVLLADDLTGQGHISREVEGPRRQVLIFLDGDLDLGTITTA